MGYGDVSSYNPDSKIQTPNMDRIAAEGLIFTNAHTPASLTIPAWFSFDGIFDEIKMYDAALSDETIMDKSKKTNLMPPDIQERVMPSGHKGKGRFGAYYNHLKYYDEWDALFRVGDHPDIVVQFDDSPIRVVFWRGTRYSPAWVMENGQWMADQSAEYFDTINGCYEHMIDPHCLFSHVRIIENTPAQDCRSLEVCARECQKTTFAGR